MPHGKTVKTIFRMESAKFFQRPKHVAATFLIGPLIIILLLFMFTQISAFGSPMIEIYSVEPISTIVAEGFENVEFFLDSTSSESRIRTEQNLVVIVDEDPFVNIYYNSALLSDSNVLNIAKKIATNIIVLKNYSQEYNSFIAEVDNISLVDLGDKSDSFYTVFFLLITLCFFISLMFLSSTIGTLSVDTICGERERGTLDTLVLSGVTPSSLILGKMLFISLIGFVILILDAASIIVGLLCLFDEIFEFLKLQLSGNYFWFVPFLVLFAEIAILETILFFVIAVSFEKVKQAMAYIGFVQIFLSLFSYSSNFLEGTVASYIPVGNVPVILDAVLKNEPYWNLMFGCSIIVLTIFFFLYIYSVNVLKHGEMRR